MKGNIGNIYIVFPLFFITTITIPTSNDRKEKKYFQKAQTIFSSFSSQDFTKYF